MKFSNVLLAFSLLIHLATASAHPGMETRLAQLAKLIEDNPKQQALFILRGGIYSQEGDWQRAREDLVQAQRLGDSIEADYELGLLHYRRGEYGQALETLNRYILKYPHHEKALLHKARAARDSGDRHAAREYYLTYISRTKAPHPGDILAAARLLAEQDVGGASEALVILDKGMSRLGVQSQLQRYAIALELERGKVSLAVERFQKLQPSLGSSPQWKVDMARLLLLDKRDLEALQLLDEARAQLEQLRPTPARQALVRAIADIKIS